MDTVFKNFEEYWLYAKILSDSQRSIIRDSLSFKEKSILKTSYIDNGWEDLLIRNTIDKILDETKEDMGIDILKIKAEITSGKPVYLKTSQWNYIQDVLKQFKKEHVNYLLNGISDEKISDTTVMLLYDKTKHF